MRSTDELRTAIERLYDSPPAGSDDEAAEVFAEFRAALNSGEARSAEPDSDEPTGWRVNAWVKKGVLVGFRMGVFTVVPVGGGQFFDKSTLPLRKLNLEDRVRVVPGGSAVRDGAYVGSGVTCMPPMFINIGAYVGEGTMVDSHALVGSCAQIGKNCHLSAAAQIGGVLEPVGAMPVIVEDEVMVGGNCGVYEGTIVKRRAVLGSGTILNRSTPVFDLVNERVISAGDGESPLVVPEGAVVVPGARAISKGVGRGWGLSLYAPVIVKYRDQKTDSRVQLLDLLR